VFASAILIRVGLSVKGPAGKLDPAEAHREAAPLTCEHLEAALAGAVWGDT
jgi:hypothetical protein